MEFAKAGNDPMDHPKLTKSVELHQTMGRIKGPSEKPRWPRKAYGTEMRKADGRCLLDLSDGKDYLDITLTPLLRSVRAIMRYLIKKVAEVNESSNTYQAWSVSSLWKRTFWQSYALADLDLSANIGALCVRTTLK